MERDFSYRICGDTIDLHFFLIPYNIFMKIKSRYLLLIIILFIGVVSVILFLRPGSIASLFSQSINSPEIDPGIPAVQSLDNQIVNETSADRAQQIKVLEQELLDAENDPEKALEIRRRLQMLRAEVQK